MTSQAEFAAQVPGEHGNSVKGVVPMALDASGVPQAVSASNPLFTTAGIAAATIDLIENNADGNTYFGSAPAGTATSAAAWQIQRQSVAGGLTTFKYAAGVSSYTQVWDNRTSLTYP